MAIVVRNAELTDIPRMQWLEIDAGARFREVGLDSIADDGAYDADELAAHVPRGTAWVATAPDGAVVGYAIASVVDGAAHLDQVSVARAVQGQGIGSALLEVVANWAASCGLAEVTLTTFRDVAFNGPYYARRGFVEVSAAEQGPGLAAIRAAERAAGIDVAPRVAMRRAVPPSGEAGRG